MLNVELHTLQRMTWKQDHKDNIDIKDNLKEVLGRRPHCFFEKEAFLFSALLLQKHGDTKSYVGTFIIERDKFTTKATCGIY